MDEIRKGGLRIADCGLAEGRPARAASADRSGGGARAALAPPSILNPLSAICNRLAAVFLAVLLLGLPGCGAIVSGDLSAASSKYERGMVATVGTAPASGAYELRTWPDGSTVAQHVVAEGDPLGFENPSGDVVTAVAGSARQPVETGTVHRVVYWIYVGAAR